MKTLALLLLVSTQALAATQQTPEREHDKPLFKVSYRRFSVSNLDGSAIWLDGAQLDLYVLSRRWIRVGFELEGGGGNATLLVGTNANLGYGLVGLTAGFQYPWRVTPFVEGRVAAGLLGGHLDGPGFLTGQATTWLFGGGIDAGIEFYTWKRMYVTAALGWIRTTWQGPDVAAMIANPSAGMISKDLTGDSLTFKLGLGI
jgi:hypothetical protein